MGRRTYINMLASGLHIERVKKNLTLTELCAVRLFLVKLLCHFLLRISRISVFKLTDLCPVSMDSLAAGLSPWWRQEGRLANIAAVW